MTNEEARELLLEHKQWLDEPPIIHGTGRIQALSLAIRLGAEALEKQSEIVHCKDCKYWVKATIKGFRRTPQVPACELAKWLCGENGFCLYGVRRAKHEAD